jgi:hypothetical protein
LITFERLLIFIHLNNFIKVKHQGMKKFLFLPILLFAYWSNAQSLKPIAQMVADAGGNFQKVSLFSEKTGDLSAAPEIGTTLRSGTVLSWDAARVQQLRALAGAPVTLTLPLDNGATISPTVLRCKSPARAKR